ncbi:AraC family transcriptional regulator [Mucilaginibacter sp.]
MKAKLEQLSLESKNSSFLCYKVKVPFFDFLWHYHPEYELTYILKGKGKRFVGDSYENYEQGDLTLLGSMLPHTWVSEAGYHGGCEAIVIQFPKAFMEPLFQYPEMTDISLLLLKAKNGLLFQPPNDNLISLIKELITYKGVEAFAALIKLLQQLSGSLSTQLSSDHFKPLKGNENQQRINKVFTYIQENFSTKVSLTEASKIIYLSESAFCKFFKRVTGRTFSDYINEIRISKSCQLIVETDKPIELIAFETGFESQTYFNRIFLRKKGLTPMGYRQKNRFYSLNSLH